MPSDSTLCVTCGRPKRGRQGRECAACAKYRQTTGLARPYGLVDGRAIAVLRGPEHPGWKGDAAHNRAKRRRARRRYPDLGPCQRCGGKATERHHKDGDPGNNRISNVALLCRRCHMVIDGRLAQLLATPRPISPPKPCTHCGVPSKPLRRGLCHACNEYQRRHGVPRPLRTPAM
jgi:hypothetical protein